MNIVLGRGGKRAGWWRGLPKISEAQKERDRVGRQTERQAGKEVGMMFMKVLPIEPSSDPVQDVMYVVRKNVAYVAMTVEEDKDLTKGRFIIDKGEKEEQVVIVDAIENVQVIYMNENGKTIDRKIFQATTKS